MKLATVYLAFGLVSGIINEAASILEGICRHKCESRESASSFERRCQSNINCAEEKNSRLANCFGGGKEDYCIYHDKNHTLTPKETEERNAYEQVKQEEEASKGTSKNITQSPDASSAGQVKQEEEASKGTSKNTTQTEDSSTLLTKAQVTMCRKAGNRQ
ncbi:hypothetical protein L0F63_000159 [Massospora cicadina]|nr:hypothetical protein L0F63_000159 [Massospora cicadina]